MMDVLESKDYFASLIGSGQVDEPSWLVELRRQEGARFNQLGWPTTRQEAWRFTSTREIARSSFGPAPELALASIDDHVLQQDSLLLVFVNGRFQSSLSRLSALPEGVVLMNLAEACTGNHEALVQSHLDQVARHEPDAFAALNSTLFKDGVFLKVAEGVKLEQPVEIVYYHEGNTPFATFPRHLILAEKGSAFSLIESYVGSAACLINSYTEFVLGDAAEVHHYFRDMSQATASHVHQLRGQLGAAAKFESHSLLTGGLMVRNDLGFCLLGEGASVRSSGLSVGQASQHQDTQVRMDHVASHCESNQFFKGIFDDKAHGVFTSRVVVRPNSQKTDSRQTNRNLLLSDSARMDSQPQLEIYADDVKCAHGSATGQLDEEALFYMNARGISNDQARVLLLYAFANEVIEQFPLAALRQEAEKFLMARFASDLLEGGAR